MDNLKIKEKLIESDIKPTIQRILIYNFLNNLEGSHLTSEEIYIKISKEFNQISRATIYNTLNLFTEKNIIHTLKIDNKEKIYECTTKPHGHFVCEKCGKIEDFPFDPKSEEKKLKNLTGEIRTIEVIAKGICKKCKTKSKN